MKKKILIAMAVIAVIIGVFSFVITHQRDKARKALADFKAQLRAQGEWLTLEDAGYPFTLETNANLERFVVLANELRARSSFPAAMYYRSIVAPGRATVAWREKSVPILEDWSTTLNGAKWTDLSRECASAAQTLAELRAELEHPPRRFGWKYTNRNDANSPRIPIAQQREAARFLAADCLSALHDRELPRANSDLHALMQLVRVHRDDLTLVSAMMRVAIAGLSSAVTWEAVQADEWDDAALLALQRDWEEADLVRALETGMVGERLFGLTSFDRLRRAATGEQIDQMVVGSPLSSGLEGVKERIVGASVSAFWRAHMEADEMFYLRHMHERLEIIRQLHTNAAGFQLKAEITAQMDEYQRVMSTPLGRYQHLFSGMAIPNFGRAFDTTLQRETECRMTITAIALKRFQLRNGRFPAALAELSPQFLTAELMDPWSGKPFHYRLNTDGTFTLYSVGGDGRDDGGDATPAVSSDEPLDMWTGKDAVWPTAAPPN